jgi:hypothetical protein
MNGVFKKRGESQYDEEPCRDLRKGEEKLGGGEEVHFLRASLMRFSSWVSSSGEIFFESPLKRAATAPLREPSKKTSRTLERADWAAADFSVAGW